MLLQALKEQQAIVWPQQAENADLKAGLERLERLIKEIPYLTASSVPVQ
jgi:hypothetical protein